MKCTNSQVYILWMLACVYICVTQYQSSTIKIRSITFTPGCSAGLFPLSPPPLSWGEHSLLSSFTDKFFPPLEFHVNTGYFPSCSTSFTQHNASEIHSCCLYPSFTPSSVQSVTPSRLTLCDPMDCSMRATLSSTISWSLLKLMSIKSVMPSNHLILCCPLLLLPSIFPSIRVFSNESALHIRWPKYWSFSFGISPPNE